MRAEGLAAEQAFHGKSQPLERAVFLKGALGIFRAGWHKAT